MACRESTVEDRAHMLKFGVTEAYPLSFPPSSPLSYVFLLLLEPLCPRHKAPSRRCLDDLLLLPSSICLLYLTSCSSPPLLYLPVRLLLSRQILVSPVPAPL